MVIGPEPTEHDLVDNLYASAQQLRIGCQAHYKGYTLEKTGHTFPGADQYELKDQDGQILGEIDIDEFGSPEELKQHIDELIDQDRTDG